MKLYTIKPLEWQEIDYKGDGNHIAETEFLNYEACPVYANVEVEWYAHAQNENLGLFKTLDDAKAACQEDYERRMGECLNCIADVKNISSEDLAEVLLDIDADNR